MLNKAEYVQEIYTYDRNMLDDYAATVKQVAALKESLEEQKSELQAAEYELEQEKRPCRNPWMNRRRLLRIMMCSWRRQSRRPQPIKPR